MPAKHRLRSDPNTVVRGYTAEVMPTLRIPVGGAVVSRILGRHDEIRSGGRSIPNALFIFESSGLQQFFRCQYLFHLVIGNKSQEGNIRER